MRTVILCVNSVWDLDPATVPPAETQGDVKYTFCGVLSDIHLQMTNQIAIFHLPIV